MPCEYTYLDEVREFGDHCEIGTVILMGSNDESEKCASGIFISAKV